LQDIYKDIQKQNLSIWLGTDEYFKQFDFTEADFKELNGFRREGIYENKFITRPSELFKQMKAEIVTLRQPRVEVSANIIGILQAMDARED
jgi:hypothetical protein